MGIIVGLEHVKANGVLILVIMEWDGNWRKGRRCLLGQLVLILVIMEWDGNAGEEFVIPEDYVS